MFVSHKDAIGPQLPTQNLSFKLMCRDCQDPIPNIVEDYQQGDLVCGSCGLILGITSFILGNRIIDTRSEWRYIFIF